MQVDIQCPTCSKKMTMEVDDRDCYSGFCENCGEILEGSLDDREQETMFKPGFGEVPKR